LAGPVPHFNTASLFFRRIHIQGVAVGTYTPAESQKAWRSLLQVLKSNNAKPIVDHIYPFEALPAAFDHLAKGPMGKVLIRVSTST
jgi:NADPH2:quinone reductase